MAKAKVFWEHVSEAVEPEVIGELSARSVIEAPRLDAAYHYGARPSNITLPADVTHKVSCVVGGGRFSGFGRVCKGFPEELGLPPKSYKVHRNNLLDLIDNLEVLGKGKYEIVESIVLFNPIKFFVLLSNGKPEERLIYHYTNGRSNGTGRGFVVGHNGREAVSACVITLDEQWKLTSRQREIWQESLAEHKRNLADPLCGRPQEEVDGMVAFYTTGEGKKYKDAPKTQEDYLARRRHDEQYCLEMVEKRLAGTPSTRKESDADHALLRVL